MKNISELGSMKTWNGGLYFFGNCTGRVRDNSMSNHKYGLWLDAGGVIGFQGNATTPSNNKWEGTWSNFGGTPPPTPFTNLRIKTYVSGLSDANDSRLFVSPSISANPENSWAWQSPNIDIPFSSQPMVTIIPFNDNTNPCANGLLPNEENEIGIETEQMLLAGLEQSLEEAYNNNNLELAKLIKEYLIYDQLYRDSFLKDSVQVLSDFYNENEI